MTLFLDLALARRLELHEGYGISDTMRRLGEMEPESGSAVEMVAGAYVVFAGRESPISRTIGLGMSGPVTAADLARVEEFYRCRQAPAQIDLCPLADPSLKELLNERGYELGEFVNFWFRQLGDKTDAGAPVADGVNVRATVPEDAEAWIQAVSGGFVEREELSAAELQIATLFFHDPQTHCFLSQVDGRAAGGGAMFIHDQVAALFSGSTLPAARGRGAQTALLHARLRAARAEGCDLAIVKTAPGSASQRNVQRVGFQLAYTKVTMKRAWKQEAEG